MYGLVPVYVHVNAGGDPLYSGAPDVIVNGLNAKYYDCGIYYVDLPFVNNDTLINATVTYNGYGVTDSSPMTGSGSVDLFVNFPEDQVNYVINGTIYGHDSFGRHPWTNEHITVSVNGVDALVDGANYTAVLRAPDEDETLNITVKHDCGQVLCEKYDRVSLSSQDLNVDLDIDVMEVSGDVYYSDSPAEDSVLFVYVNDRPMGPITAASKYDDSGKRVGPMFSVNIPGAHCGDHVLITASNGIAKGIVAQDAMDNKMFLTVNLKKIDVYVPYT
ncbi:hypothetical protein CUJ83_05605 [Methanocella sp. CWC-04]|uniref:Uncharacterized protein n=2 Tax=Methanooceanicella nereidis TaxID=2052831 RepID=A0AAP2REA4_9EURY|nr:hypothetical protein [Methanocella sp. CWC-04]